MVYSRRGCVTPYESFLQQLGELEPILKARADVERANADGGGHSRKNGGGKRALESDDDDVEMADN